MLIISLCFDSCRSYQSSYLISLKNNSFNIFYFKFELSSKTVSQFQQTLSFEFTQKQNEPWSYKFSLQQIKLLSKTSINQDFFYSLFFFILINSANASSSSSSIESEWIYFSVDFFSSVFFSWFNWLLIFESRPLALSTFISRTIYFFSFWLLYSIFLAAFGDALLKALSLAILRGLSAKKP